MNLRERARIHEAGHLVCARVGGLEASEVLALDGEGHSGHFLPGPREVDRMTRAEFDRMVESIGIADLAGTAALEVFGDEDPRGGAANDWDQALVSARQLAPSAPEARRDAMYRRALALCRENRAAIERLAETLAANHDRLAGSEVRIALDAAFAAWPTPRFDPASEHAVAIRIRSIFEAECRGRGVTAEAPWAERYALWRAAEVAARSGRPFRMPTALNWTPEQREAARSAYFVAGIAGVIEALSDPHPVHTASPSVRLLKGATDVRS